MLTRINATLVTHTVLGHAINALAEMPDDKRQNFDHRMNILLGALQNEVERKHLMATAIAIDFRLRALARLVESTFVNGCEVDLVTRRPKISPAALLAACHEPLVRNHTGLATFDAHGFKARLLH